MPAAVSVGTNPTFRGTVRTVEAHLLDFDGDLYGQRLEVHGHRRVRGMVAYPSVDDLVVAMAGDVAQVRLLLAADGSAAG